MIHCPHCGFENIEGSDVCEGCEQPLTHEYLAEPATALERGLVGDHIPELHPNVPVSVSGATPVREVLGVLVEKKIGSVLVVEERAIIGIFSERDALVKLGADAGVLGDRPVSEFMTGMVETLEETAKIAFAVQRMDMGNYRHIPIVDREGHPTGIVSARDILQYMDVRMRSGEAGR